MSAHQTDLSTLPLALVIQHKYRLDVSLAVTIGSNRDGDPLAVVLEKRRLHDDAWALACLRGSGALVVGLDVVALVIRFAQELTHK